MFLPFALVVLGGLIGALFGITAAVANMLLLRSINNVALKIVLSVVIIGAASALYFVVAIFVLGIMTIL